MKKMMSMLLVLLMVLAMTVTAAAEDDGGSITITNAQQGQTYNAYKIFDAAYDAVTNAIAYSTKDAQVIDLLKNDDSPFDVAETPDRNGNYQVTGKPDADGETIRDWIRENLIGEGRPITEATASKPLESGNTLVFEALPYGYYYVDSNVGSVASVTSNAPDAVIVDKNDSTPKDPEKTADKNTAMVGDLVNYTATLTTTNFVTEANGTETKQIIKYYVKDTAEDLEPKAGSLTVEIYADAEYTELAAKLENLTFTDGMLEIPWAVNKGTEEAPEWESLYPSPAYMKISYSAYVLSSATEDGKATNHIEFSYTTDAAPDDPPTDIPEDPGKTTVDVYTFTLNLEKVGEDGTTVLTGAKFVLQNTDELYYKLSEREADKKVEWVAEAERDVIEATASGVEFTGLDAGTYTLTEIEAPKGYNLPTQPWIVTISEGENGKYAAVLSKGDDITKLEGTDGTFTATIRNTKGAVLPSTGGQGLTAMILTGSLIFVSTALILVTRKRLYNDINK